MANEKHMIYYMSILDIIDILRQGPEAATPDTRDVVMVLYHYVQRIMKKPITCMLCDNSATKHPPVIIIILPLDRTAEEGETTVFSLCPKCGADKHGIRDRTADVIKKLTDHGCVIEAVHRGTLTTQ